MGTAVHTVTDGVVQTSFWYGGTSGGEGGGR